MRGTTLVSDLQFPRHLTEGAGQTKGEGRPVFPDRALEGGRKRLAALTCIPEGPSPALGSCGSRGRRAPGCGSARACRCAGSSGFRAGRECRSTRRSRRRCGRRGTEGRKCRTDLEGTRGSKGGAHRVPPAGSASGRGEAGSAARGSGAQRQLSVGGSEGPRGN